MDPDQQPPTVEETVAAIEKLRKTSLQDLTVHQRSYTKVEESTRRLYP
jgi:hypothetical protein